MLVAHVLKTILQPHNFSTFIIRATDSCRSYPHNGSEECSDHGNVVWFSFFAPGWLVYLLSSTNSSIGGPIFRSRVSQVVRLKNSLTADYRTFFFNSSLEMWNYFGHYPSFGV